MKASQSTFTGIIILTLWFSPPASAGLGTFTGGERAAWTQDRHSVVIARIHRIEKWKGQYGPYRATLVPLATLGGTFDPSLQPELAVRFYVSDLTSSIHLSTPLPKEGATVMAVVVVGVLHGDEKQPSNWIVSDICTFMPGESALVVIDGLCDPRVPETLKKIQGTRTKVRVKDVQPTTRPAH